MPIELFEHQKKVADLLDKNDSFGLFLEQGLGKTVCILNHAVSLHKQGKLKDKDSILVVAPKSACGAWTRDVAIFDEPDREWLKSHMTVINYDKVWRGGKKNEYGSRKWTMVVFDESHFLKNRGRKRTDFCLELSVNAKYRYILTGTPIGNGKLENIFTQFALLSPIKYKRSIGCKWLGSWTMFCNKYCYLDQWFNPYAYHNVNELQDIISEHSITLKKKDCLDLPDKLPDEVIEIEQTEKKFYKDMFRESIAIMQDETAVAENALARMTKLRQITSGFVTTDTGETMELKCNKTAMLKDFVERMNGEPFVIFYEYEHSMLDICNALQEVGVKFQFLNGKQKNKDIWKEYQTNDTQVFIVQYKSGCAGIDLFKANTILYYEPTIESTTLEQSRDRIHRIGQHNPCSYYHFITKGTIEERIYKSLCKYETFNKKLFSEYIREYCRKM